MSWELRRKPISTKYRTRPRGNQLPVSVHNPDQYLSSLRQIIAQGRKRVGLLVGAGAPASVLAPDGSGPLIPTVAGLTERVLAALSDQYGATLDAIRAELDDPNIEMILSRVRSLAGVIGTTEVHGLNGPLRLKNQMPKLRVVKV